MTSLEKNIKLFVGHLPFDVTEDDLISLLHGCGQIKSITIKRDPYTNHSKGFGHIEYGTELEAVEAFKRLIGKEFRGRVLKLDFCDDIYRDKYSDLLAASVYAQEQAAQQYKPPIVSPPLPLLPEVPPPPPAHLLTPYTQTLPVLPQIAVPIPTILQPNIPISVPVPVSIPIQPPPPPPGPVVPVVPVQQPKPPVPEHTEVKPEPKRPKLIEPDLLIQNGKVVNKELFYVIKKMSMLDVYNLVKKIDSLMERSPNTARSILNSNPYMRSALVHAKLLLGYKDLNFTNLTNVDFSNILEYFVIH